MFAVFGVFGCAASGYTVFGEVEAFSGDIMFSARIMGGRAEYAYQRMCGVISDINKQCSTTRADSDVAKFNASGANADIEVGEHCYKIFIEAKEYAALTDGAYDPTIMPLAELWHVDAESLAEYRPSIDGTHVSPLSLPTVEEVQSALEYCGVEHIDAFERDGKYYLVKSDARVKLDFGGIAKGYAVDKCVEILKEYDISSALLDISGNAYFYGSYIERGNKSDWRVGVVSPRPRAAETLARGYVCAFTEKGDASAVTSGDYMRYYIYDGAGDNEVFVPHIITPSGVPAGLIYSDGQWKNAGDNVISATVIGKSSAMCDVLATAVVALGLADGARLLQKVGYKGLIFTEKRFIIVGNVELYKTDEYDGYKAYERVDDIESGV